MNTTTEKTMEEAVVLYTVAAMGHLVCMVELGKLILANQPSLSIQIIIFSFPVTLDAINSYISDVTATTPSISFHRLPIVTLPSTATNIGGIAALYERVRLANPHLYQVCLSISKSHTINALILDAFCCPSLSIASQLDIPAYFFFTCCAGNLAFTLYFPTIHHQNSTNKSFRDLKIFLDFPGIPPILSSDLPEPVLDHDMSYEGYLDMAISLQKSAGIITNSFELLEARALKAISDGLCVPNSVTPPVYCVGPLIATSNQTVGGHDTECLTWLDSQQNQSVIFLCFGSCGYFSSKEQLKEIAIGLERSGQRFLWVVRNPASKGKTMTNSPHSDPDLHSLLPDGFLDRTKERGLVVKKWAPQVAVLKHKSVGGFVTHCGWNSILEAVCAGVPMVAWPLYAEQRFNRVLLVEEMKIALPMNESENGFVTALEVKKRVSELMDSELGNSVRDRIVAMKNAADAALREGGPSRVAMSRLIESWKQSQ